MTAIDLPINNNNNSKNIKVESDVNSSENIRNYSKLTSAKNIGTDYSFKREIVWKNAIGFIILHLLAFIGFVVIVTGNITFKTFLWMYIVAILSTEGVTIGAHRLYSHKSFKAHPLLKSILIIFQTIAGQNCMYIWVRDHRLHHRYADTDGDPHNAKRGFFFSHMGWLMTKKHPLVKELGKSIDMSDLEADWMVMLQKKHYKILYFIFAIFIPVLVPVHFFNEPWMTSLLSVYFFRYVVQLNGTWLVNSAAHIYGTRPYDKNLQPVENWFVSMISFGEGWHNYHHTFPWDYKAAELSMHFNQSASIIRFFEKIGLAFDLKTASSDMVTNRIKRCGDGTHYELGYEEARAAVTAVGPVHPLNPTFTTKQEAPKPILQTKGLPLFHANDVIKEAEEVNMRKRNVSFGN